MPKAITKKVKEADFPLVFEQPQSEHSVVADIPPHGQDQKIKYQVFECLQTSGLPFIEMPALIAEEKGQKHLDYLVANRKRVEEERKQRELDE